MVPLNMTYLHCLQHSLFEHLFNLYYANYLKKYLAKEIRQTMSSKVVIDSRDKTVFM